MSISLVIGWVVPPTRIPVTTRIITSLVGDPNLNLHLPQASWEGGQPKSLDISKPTTWNNRTPTIFLRFFCGFGRWLWNHTSLSLSLFLNILYIWVFSKIGVPQNGWFLMENPIKMHYLEVPLFLETPIYVLWIDPIGWWSTYATLDLPPQ